MSDQGWTAPGGDTGRPEPQPPQPQSPVPPPQPPGGWQQPQQAPYVPQRQLDFRPGIIPLRPLTLNDVFGAVFRAVRGNVGATVGLAAITSLVFLVPFTALGAWVSSQESSVSLDASANDAAVGLLGTLGSTIPSIGSSLSAILLSGFLAYVIGQAVLGRKVTAGETWRGTVRRIWALIGATLLSSLIYLVTIGIIIGVPVGLLIAGGTAGNDGAIAAGLGLLLLAMVVLVVAMLFLWTRLAFVTSSLILENLSVGKAFSRSWRLTGGQPFWRLLGLRLLTAIAIGIAGSLITSPLVLLGVGLVATGLPVDQVYIWQAVITGISGVIGGALTTPITAGIDALLYVDQRIRREGLDVQLVQTAQGTAAPPWATAQA